MQSHSLSVLTINVSNIVKNYLYIKGIVGNKAPVAAVVKANCYGLGAKEIAPHLEKAGCSEFYVATLDEGIELREALPLTSIYVLSGINKGEEYYFLKYHLIPVLNTNYQIDLWANCCESVEQKLDALLHVDLGMTRLGLAYGGFTESVKRINDRMNILYVLGHLSSSDDKNSVVTQEQLHKLQNIKKEFPQFKYSLANSCGILWGEEYFFDQVRLGIKLYNAQKDNLVITLTSEIINIFHNETPVSVGYSCTYTTKLATITATIPVGHADGYPYCLGNTGYCFINKTKVPIIGKISMDYMSLDITSLSKNECQIGQKVELIGKNINVSEIAKMSNTIEYNILCSFGRRYKREYVF